MYFYVIVYVSFVMRLASTRYCTFGNIVLTDALARCIIKSSADMAVIWLGNNIQGIYSLSGRTSYRNTSWSLQVTIMVVSLWNSTGISTALLLRWLSNFRVIGKVLTRISRLRDFMRSCGKTSYRLVHRGPVSFIWEVNEARGLLQVMSLSHHGFIRSLAGLS